MEAYTRLLWARKTLGKPAKGNSGNYGDAWLCQRLAPKLLPSENEANKLEMRTLLPQKSLLFFIQLVEIVTAQDGIEKILESSIESRNYANLQSVSHLNL